MRGWFVIALFVGLVSFAALASDNRFRRKSHTWKHRLLVVFSPSANHPGALRQHGFFEQSAVGFRDRELLYVPVVAGETTMVRQQRVDAEAQAALRQEFGVESDAFAVLLIGKDGGVKLRRESPVANDELFALIDSMPMRQQEMRQQERQGRAAGQLR
jgi:hypothetical protein